MAYPILRMKSPPPVVFYLPVRAEVAPRVHARFAEPPGELPAHFRLQRGVVLVARAKACDDPMDAARWYAAAGNDAIAFETVCMGW